MIEGINIRRVESTPSQDPTLGTASRQQQEQRGEGRSAGASVDTLTLSPEAQQQLSKLQQRDREVRSHEQAHISAGGQHVSGGASYSYTKGPDGRPYAIGGSVSIDTSPVAGNPEATEEKARMVRSAALAPGQPSAQDQNVAAQAASMEMQAQTEKRAQQEGGGGQEGLAADAGASAQGAPGKDSGGKGQGGSGGLAAVRGTDATTTPAEALEDAALSIDKAEELERGGRTEKTAVADTASRATAETPVTPRSSGAGAGANTGFLFGVMEVQARSDRVASLYQAQQNRFIPPTALAPNGTGISYTV